MIIKITDIPPEGRKVIFALDESCLNERVDLAQRSADSQSIQPPSYVFSPPTSVVLELFLEGSTVVVNGEAHAQYFSLCARCAEDTEKTLNVPVNIILKPRPTRGPDAAQDEDINFGYYDDQEVDCDSVVEEILVLALPYTVLCKDDCRGLCPSCGVNLNVEKCSCVSSSSGDLRFAVLRGLKINDPESGKQ
jgi:uncharacterized protein